jgi:nascent polypeptide-associated complex subunit beta
LLGLLA